MRLGIFCLSPTSAHTRRRILQPSPRFDPMSCQIARYRQPPTQAGRCAEPLTIDHGGDRGPAHAHHVAYRAGEVLAVGLVLDKLGCGLRTRRLSAPTPPPPSPNRREPRRCMLVTGQLKSGRDGDGTRPGFGVTLIDAVAPSEEAENGALLSREARCSGGSSPHSVCSPHWSSALSYSSGTAHQILTR